MLMHHDDSRSSTAHVPDIPIEAARAQVERVLASDTLRSAEALRRLLRFLADKTFSGEADGLKEYSVGLDALGKPPTYDPRQDSGVRLQASRLRQKLDEYYRGEGKNDAVVVELPKSKFKIAWRPASPSVRITPADAVTPSVPGVQQSLAPEPAGLKTWRRFAVGAAGALLLLMCLDAWWVLRASQAVPIGAATQKLTPDVEALWSPFMTSKRHMIIVYSDPVFVEFQREGSPNILFRRRDVTGWDDVVGSPEFSQLSRSLGNPPAKPNYEYVSRGELAATFTLSQFFAGRRGDMSVTRLGELSWQQFADNDVILLAARTRVAQLEAALPVSPAFLAGDAGINNLKPLPGEPPIFGDGGRHPDSNGESFELVSVLPGPLGRTTVASFTGGFGWGVIGAIQSLTDAGFARDAVQRLKTASGVMPRYYQIVMKIKYREGTPTEAYCVAQRALTLSQDRAPK
jgi:hypothetical protein